MKQIDNLWAWRDSLLSLKVWDSIDSQRGARTRQTIQSRTFFNVAVDQQNDWYGIARDDGFVELMLNRYDDARNLMLWLHELSHIAHWKWYGKHHCKVWRSIYFSAILELTGYEPELINKRSSVYDVDGAAYWTLRRFYAQR